MITPGKPVTRKERSEVNCGGHTSRNIVRGKDPSSVQHAPDGIHEFLCGIRLARIPVGAGRCHLTDQLVGIANRKDQDFCFRAMQGHFRNGGESNTEKGQFGVGTKPNEILGMLSWTQMPVRCSNPSAYHRMPAASPISSSSGGFSQLGLRSGSHYPLRWPE